MILNVKDWVDGPLVTPECSLVKGQNNCAVNSGT